MLWNLLLGLFLIAHAAIHTGFVVPRPATSGGPPWPFDPSHTWLPIGLSAEGCRRLAAGMLAACLGAFVLAGIAGVGLATHLWAPLTLIGALASAALLVLFFHRWLVVGLLIDAAVAWLAISGWTPALLR